jgi:hypothetical protein
MQRTNNQQIKLVKLSKINKALTNVKPGLNVITNHLPTLGNRPFSARTIFNPGGG